MPRRVRVVALFEDAAHERLLRHLLRHLLRRLGLGPRDVEYKRCGDCTAVERQLVAEVRGLREMNYQHDIGLLVVIDADALGREGRKRRLDALLRTAGLAERQAGERIAYVVPTLEAENWYVHFCCPAARPIDEAKDYKESPQWRALRGDLGAAGRQLAETWYPEVIDEPPSIHDARTELRRVYEGG